MFVVYSLWLLTDEHKLKRQTKLKQFSSGINGFFESYTLTIAFLSTLSIRYRRVNYAFSYIEERREGRRVLTS